MGMTTIISWLRARCPELEGLDEDFDLIKNRVIDSLHFMEFLFLLQETTGRDITPDETSLNHFRTLRAIRENFFNVDGSEPVAPTDNGEEMEEMVF